MDSYRWYRDFILSLHAEEKLPGRIPLTSAEAQAWVNMRIWEVAKEDIRHPARAPQI